MNTVNRMRNLTFVSLSRHPDIYIMLSGSVLPPINVDQICHEISISRQTTLMLVAGFVSKYENK